MLYLCEDYLGALEALEALESLEITFNLANGQ